MGTWWELCSECFSFSFKKQHQQGARTQKEIPQTTLQWLWRETELAQPEMLIKGFKADEPQTSCPGKDRGEWGYAWGTQKCPEGEVQSWAFDNHQGKRQELVGHLRGVER